MSCFIIEEITHTLDNEKLLLSDGTYFNYPLGTPVMPRKGMIIRLCGAPVTMITLADPKDGEEITAYAK